MLRGVPTHPSIVERRETSIVVGPRSSSTPPLPSPHLPPPRRTWPSQCRTPTSAWVRFSRSYLYFIKNPKVSAQTVLEISSPR